MYKQETDLINDKNVREDLVGRVEVLDKVKGLLLLPNLEMATTRQVADFYGVGMQAIYSLVHDNRDEIDLDGYVVLKADEIKDMLATSLKEGSKITNMRGKWVLFDDGVETSFSYTGTALFPKRAILRVGMLLRDSEVAKEVRTQLLNIEEVAPPQVKEFSINNEKEIVERIVKARISNDWTAYDKANFEYTEYQNRHIKHQEDIIEAQKPKVKEFENLLFSDVSINATEIASRYVGENGKDVLPKDINLILEAEGLIKSYGSNKVLTRKGKEIGGVSKSFTNSNYLVEYVQWTIKASEDLHNIFTRYNLIYR